MIAAADTAITGTLAVPGAEIYYEQRGAGPLLLLIPGGPQDAGVFADLARALADNYTVVSYDPRGNSRSPFAAEPQPLDVGIQADDAARLIEALADGPAYVLGTSGGAHIGLDLAARHPHLVKALVAHEPPTMMLLDDPSPALAFDRDLHQTYLDEGVDAAMGKFFAMAGMDDGAGSDAPPEFDMPPEAAETFARVSGNFGYWLAHGMIPLSTFEPDIGTLRSGAARIVVAIGEESKGMPIEEMSLALAGKLGVEPVAFPGDHTGFDFHAGRFAQVLQQTLANK